MRSDVPGTRRLSVEDRRAQLVECALTLADRGGMSAVTVRGVAEEAKVSLGVVHYCFDDKEQLVAAMIEKVIAEQLEALIGSIPTGTLATGRDALRTWVDEALTAVWRRAAEYPDRWLLMIESMLFSLRQPIESASAGQAMVQHQTAEKYGRAYLSEIGERCQMRWDIEERTLVRAALQMLFGTVQWWLVDRDDAAARNSLTVVAGWIADSASPK
ncbi:TetR/AcrR family transcriptional regulator [Nocardia sp. 348MFTsu5.1]|uniref:TetR/AcrR family transcriptional regulator n=1 Tax=Nocardia sp. 348MFTsu5.1 TaxID=1172185 RepID=UPI000381B170|nr:TetR family transcriptional regulator [Nocardia sp. 348MFTsu5.1]